jgi:hypothetical protein
MSGLKSLRSLARILRVSRSQLENVACNIDAHYHQWPSKDERTGKVREIRSPSIELKAIQRRIARKLFRGTAFGPEVQGGVRGRSPLTNAAMHLGRPCLVTVDVRRFFPSVRHTIVYRMLRSEFGFGRSVAGLVTRLVTYDGQLPQGAPTSGAIANWLLHMPVDQPVVAEAARLRLSYSRFVDDLAASGDQAREIINMIARQLSTRRLAISRKKTEKLRIMPRSKPQKITGLLVNGAKPSVPKEKRDQVRAAIHALRNLPPGSPRDHDLQSVRGRIAHVKRYNPGSAARLERQLRATGICD